VWVTTVVVVTKLYGAYRSGSISVLAEGLQSTVDILMSLLAFAAVSYSAKPPDERHAYGHGKAELLSSAVQMIFVLGSSVFILIQAYLRFVTPRPIAWDWGLATMSLALLINLGLMSFVRQTADRTGSTALHSEALHLRSDLMASVGVLVGVGLVALTGQNRLDPIAAAAFTVIAMVTAVRQLVSVVHPLMDGALPPEEIAKIVQVLDSHTEVRGYHNVRTRIAGTLRHLELHVMLDDDLSFPMAHEIAEQVEAEISNALGGALVSIHYEPYEAEVAHRMKEHEGKL